MSQPQRLLLVTDEISSRGQAHMYELGVAWSCNPEQERLRHELPFLAEILDVCAASVSEQKKDAIKHEALLSGIRAQRRAEMERERRRKARNLKLAEQARVRRANKKAAEEKRRHDAKTGQYRKDIADVPGVPDARIADDLWRQVQDSAQQSSNVSMLNQEG